MVDVTGKAGEFLVSWDADPVGQHCDSGSHGFTIEHRLAPASASSSAGATQTEVAPIVRGHTVSGVAAGSYVVRVRAVAYDSGTAKRSPWAVYGGR